MDKIASYLALTNERDCQIVAITSAVSNEGKSTLSSQLAISLARSTNQKILLIDADLRSPCQHRLFDVSNETGLVDALSHLDRWPSLPIETKVKNLSVLPAGRAVARPSRYFSDGSWTALLNQAREHYGHIVVDTPPILAASESLVACEGSDGTLICVLRDVTRADALHRAHARLTAAGVAIMGCVFGGMPQSDYAYRYGTYDRYSSEQKRI